MKTRYKIVAIAICAYFGIFLGPVIASNVYCDFIAQEMCTSRITGVGLPPFNLIPLSMPSDDECFFENAEGVMVPCYTKTGYFEWPFPPRIHEYEHNGDCEEICLDSQPIIIDENKGDDDYGITSNIGFPIEEYPSIENLDAVFKSCKQWEQARKTNFASPDGTKYAITGVGYRWFNSTHYIDNNTCTWQEIK